MKKLIIFGVVIIILFVTMAVLTNMSNDKNGESKYYDNVVQPEKLEEKLNNEEDLTVYFYSPECVHCQNATPRLMPLADEMGVEILQYNVLENPEGWNDYNIEGTPTLIRFEDGEEVARIVGAVPDEEFRTFLEENVVN